MPNTTRQEMIRYWRQANNDLERFLENLQLMDAIFQKANQEFKDHYNEYIQAITGFAQIIIKTQNAWEKLRREKL